MSLLFNRLTRSMQNSRIQGKDARHPVFRCFRLYFLYSPPIMMGCRDPHGPAYAVCQLFATLEMKTCI